MIRFGSIPAALAYVRGDRLGVDSPTKSFGTTALRETRAVSFRLTNWTSRPIVILGAHATCSCAVASGLPATHAPRGEHTLEIKATPSKTGNYTEIIRCFTDDARQSEIQLKVTGQTVDGPEPPRS